MIKRIIKKIVVAKIWFAAKILLLRKKPEIIAVTGSAGKTTTKRLIAHLLKENFDVLSSNGGYNTEIGVPLALLQEKVPDDLSSLLKWVKIIFRSYKKALFAKNYPEKVVLEMGADSPGDIKKLAKSFRPSRSVILTVLPVHLESFNSVEEIANEKEFLARYTKKGGLVFLNADNEYTSRMKPPEGVQKILFGYKNKEADIVADNVNSDLQGLSFEIVDKKSSIKIKTRLYGKQMTYPVLAAIAVARSYHISFEEIVKALKSITPEKGRMNVLEGIRDSIIIDDSYNANPQSMIKAIEFLSKQKGRKIAALGTMAELGDYTKRGHEEVGEYVGDKVDILLTVGDIANQYIATAAEDTGLKSEKIKRFDSSEEAGDYLRKIIRKGDIVLLKGSQNTSRMEKAVAKVISEKLSPEKTLVRQAEFWKRK